ncbi:hypothetical protein PG985_002974 [Apiospora marii]|uniref:uncharacterized protein n=1 Tax=Apiospora marii TaxID=335849 RepID=UPI00312F98AE
MADQPVIPDWIKTMTYLQCAWLVLATFTVGSYLYNVYLHPLRKFPGSWTHRVSRLPWAYHSLRGDLHEHLLRLQRQHGTHVRIAPNELMCSGGTVWKDMYAAAARGREEIAPTHHLLFPSRFDTPHFIVDPDAARRGRIRGALLPSFSERSMRQYEPTIQRYLDLFLRRLQENCDGGNRSVNVRDWYNYFAFDVLGQLAFSSDFQCLENSELHPWISSMFSDSLFGPVCLSVLVNLGFQMAVDLLYKQLGARFRKLRQSARLKVFERLDSEKPRDDFTEVLLRKLGTDTGTEAILMTGPTLIFAGSETQATLLYGLTYLLITNPAALQKLNGEVRGAFAQQEDITYTDVSRLKYLVACINEGLRCFPSVANASTRHAPLSGCVINGAFVPGGVRRCITQVLHEGVAWLNTQMTGESCSNPLPLVHVTAWARCEPKFNSPYPSAFYVHPATKFRDTRLAHAEIRMVLATVILNFDMELAEEQPNLLKEMRAYGVFWSKPDLNLRLKPIK